MSESPLQVIARHELTDQERRLVLHGLAGHALHFDDWIRDTPDGEPRITAVRSRVSDLEAKGWGFSHFRRPDTTVEYRLVYIPEPSASPESDADVDQGAEQLSLELPTPRPGLYDVDEAA